MTALSPKLTPLDERVLAAAQTPRRARSIAEDMTPKPVGYHPQWCSDELRMRYGRAVEAKLTEVVGVLRGLEHLELVRRSKNGWWTAVRPPDADLPQRVGAEDGAA
jgi:hypothetical protein